MTIHSIQKIEENSKEPKETPKPKPQCTFCRKMDHQLDACPKFKTETLEKRLRFVKVTFVKVTCPVIVERS